MHKKTKYTFNYRYDLNLVHATKVGKLKGIVQGLGVGTLFLLLFSTYGLAFWYGSSLIFDGLLDLADMITAFFSILIGTFSLGGVSWSYCVKLFFLNSFFSIITIHNVCCAQKKTLLLSASSMLHHSYRYKIWYYPFS